MKIPVIKISYIEIDTPLPRVIEKEENGKRIQYQKETLYFFDGKGIEEETFDVYITPGYITPGKNLWLSNPEIKLFIGFQKGE